MSPAPSSPLDGRGRTRLQRGLDSGEPHRAGAAAPPLDRSRPGPPFRRGTPYVPRLRPAGRTRAGLMGVVLAAACVNSPTQASRPACTPVRACQGAKIFQALLFGLRFFLRSERLIALYDSLIDALGFFQSVALGVEETRLRVPIRSGLRLRAACGQDARCRQDDQTSSHNSSPV